MVADKCLWSFHCTGLADYSLADELKSMNSVSKHGRRMRYSTADQHYLTCLIFWSVPLKIQTNKLFIGRPNGTYFHSSAALCCQRIPLCQRLISLNGPLILKFILGDSDLVMLLTHTIHPFIVLLLVLSKTFELHVLHCLDFVPTGLYEIPKAPTPSKTHALRGTSCTPFHAHKNPFSSNRARTSWVGLC